MLGAIFTALSGMDAFSQGLQTISNNVANMNTPGYKGSTVNFSDVFNAGAQGLPTAGEGDSDNVGAGVRFAKPEIDFTQGQLQQTTGALDLAIQGDGFMVLRDGDQTFYARTGSFSVDSDGFITEQGTLHHLAILNSSNQPVAANINAMKINPAAATTSITFQNNLSSSATSDTVSNINVFDSNGVQHAWQAQFAPKSGTPGAWTVTILDENSATVGTGTLTFTNGQVDSSSAKIHITATPTNAQAMSVTLDFTGVTSFSSGTDSTLAVASVDGNGQGTLSNVTVDQSGAVSLSYSNGKTATLGSVAMALFQNPQQLQRVSGALFENANAATFRLTTSGSQGAGTLESKQIESSNVDLAHQFGELILIQRGFQASSEVVSVTNDMLQQLFGMRGQG
jgi:flagellar hook protein FlgE